MASHTSPKLCGATRAGSRPRWDIVFARECLQFGVIHRPVVRRVMPGRGRRFVNCFNALEISRNPFNLHLHELLIAVFLVGHVGSPASWPPIGCRTNGNHSLFHLSLGNLEAIQIFLPRPLPTAAQSGGIVRRLLRPANSGGGPGRRQTSPVPDSIFYRRP